MRKVTSASSNNRFDKNEAAKTMKMTQQKSIIGSVKICKNFINFKTLTSFRF